MAEQVEKKGKGSSRAESSLLDEIVEYTRLPKEDEGYDVARRGVEILLKDIFQRDKEEQNEVRVDKKLVDGIIRELDVRLSKQIDAIVHHEKFQSLERPWRGLKHMVERTDFKENTKVEFINATEEDLLDDFEDSAGVVESGLYRQVYTEEFGQYGGEPVGVIIGNYEFSHSAPDVKLLGYLAALSAMTHAPFIASAGPAMFGLDSFSGLGRLKNLEAVFDGPQYAKWRSFRETEDSRNVGLALPRFMLRPTYGENLAVRSFDYVERIEKDSDYLWGNAAFAYATRLTESFAKYRWCPNIIGPQSGGEVSDLPIDLVDVNGEQVIVGPTETAISDRKEYELSNLGFIPLTLRKESDKAVFFSSSSCQKSKKFANDEEGRQAELNYRLGTQLPYLFIVNRIAHYIKVIQRENLGSWKNRSDVELELNKWIRQYVADQENPSPTTRSLRPLRKAAVSVSEIEEDAGWYSVSMEVTPHFKFMGANFTLSLSGLLER
jgi:type VI secretion system protein ImpC